MAVSLVIPVQALSGAVAPPPPPPPPPPALAAPRPCAAPSPFGVARNPWGPFACARSDRLLEERALAEVERLRHELGASDMALEASRSRLARERIEGALDQRASVGACDAAAARHGALAAGGPFGGTGDPSGATSANGLCAAERAADDSGAGPRSRLEALRDAVTGAAFARSRTFVDLFA